MECRVLPSAISGFSPSDDGLGEPQQDDPDDDDGEATDPEQVTGAFLTSIQYGDARRDSYDDVVQGDLDTCVFASTLAAVARTSAPLASRITKISSSDTSVTYQVGLYRPSSAGSTTWAPTTQTVVYSGRVVTDLEFGDDGEVWPLVMQRAYLQMCNSAGLDYHEPKNAFGALLGTQGKTALMDATLAQAQVMRTSLRAGTPIVVGSESSSLRYIYPEYGIVSHHAYTVMGVEIPADGDLKKTFVTIRNPWGIDAEKSVFDANHDEAVSDAEFEKWSTGLDGCNDGLVRVPWIMFSNGFNYAYTATYSGSTINQPMSANQQVQFTQTTQGPFTIYQGQQLKVTVKAVDPDGNGVFYSLLSDYGNVNPQSGVFTWETFKPRLGYSYHSHQGGNLGAGCGDHVFQGDRSTRLTKYFLPAGKSDINQG